MGNLTESQKYPGTHLRGTGLYLLSLKRKNENPHRNYVYRVVLVIKSVYRIIIGHVDHGLLAGQIYVTINKSLSMHRKSK